MIELIFVIDPMCSWCWGFHPTINNFRSHHAKTHQFSLVVGGLRTTGDMAWNKESRAYLQKHWQNVAEKTGQPFCNSLFDKKTFDYDTYPACKAIVTARELWGDEESFEYLYRIQYAFYVEGKDITSEEILFKYVTHDKEAFEKLFYSERATTLMMHDFSKARSMGANAFPSTVKIDSDGHMVCIKGFRTENELLQF